MYKLTLLRIEIVAFFAFISIFIILEMYLLTVYKSNG